MANGGKAMTGVDEDPVGTDEAPGGHLFLGLTCRRVVLSYERECNVRRPRGTPTAAGPVPGSQPRG